MRAWVKNPHRSRSATGSRASGSGPDRTAGDARLAATVERRVRDRREHAPLPAPHPPPGERDLDLAGGCECRGKAGADRYSVRVGEPELDRDTRPRLRE